MGEHTSVTARLSDGDLQNNLQIIQSMIDVSAERLEGLRTQCATSAELTQQEIRTLEGKLIKLFSEQLVAKAQLKKNHPGSSLLLQTTCLYPSLKQWLQVVGVSSAAIAIVCLRVASVEELQECTEHELRTYLLDNFVDAEELSRLLRALRNLKRYTDVLQRRGLNSGEEVLPPLYWDSWDDRQQLHRSAAGGLSPRAPRASVPTETYFHGSLSGAAATVVSRSQLIPISPSVSSISRLVGEPLSPRTLQGGRLPMTPPRKSKLYVDGDTNHAYRPVKQSSTVITTALMNNTNNNSTSNSAFPLTKSKSHECHLAATIRTAELSGGGADGAGTNRHQQGSGSVAAAAAAAGGRRSRLATEPGPDVVHDEGHTFGGSPLPMSPLKSPQYTASSTTTTDSDDSSYKSSTNLNTPLPVPPVMRNMSHQITHRFTKTFKMMSTCGYCLRPIYFGTGLKCKECKYTCHRECEEKVAPSCGLPPEFLDEFKKKYSLETSSGTSSTGRSISNGGSNSSSSSAAKQLLNSLTRHHPRKRSCPQPTISISSPIPLVPDSSSNTSSCNSSTPSSPAVVQLLSTGPYSSHRPQEFYFPDVALCGHFSPPPPSSVPSSGDPGGGGGGGGGVHQFVSAQNSRDSSDITVTSVSGSTDSDRTPCRVDSQDSQVSDMDAASVVSVSEALDGRRGRWPRQNSLSMREWDIPYEELKMFEAIGRGRFGTVYRGYWHGDVAVKVLNVHYLDDAWTLEQFKIEVATFRKTRHENLVLFMGACTQPPTLAIVTSLSRGMTLYTHIHLRRDKFIMSKTTVVAQQISQGMGYLHAKGIIHKDLKSKNIFLENGKVVISDFGLFSVTRLCFGNRKTEGLGIPPGWLCYLSPEIVRSLHALQSRDDELPFTKASDVYAFGTVWYELLCGEWPFKDQPPEAIIWQVGRGMKQPMANLQASRDVKDILMLCWSFRATDRPDFIDLLNMLDKLPKKRLSRSPSHPIHLSRSAESVF